MKRYNWSEFPIVLKVAGIFSKKKRNQTLIYGMVFIPLAGILIESIYSV